MNSMFKAAVRISSLRVLLHSSKSIVGVNCANQQRQLARNLWYMCSSNANQFTIAKKLQSHTNTCSCGCGKHGVHSKGNY